MLTNLPAKVFKPATVAILSWISTSTVPRQCLPAGNPNAAMASDTRTNPIQIFVGNCRWSHHLVARMDSRQCDFVIICFIYYMS